MPKVKPIQVVDKRSTPPVVWTQSDTDGYWRNQDNEIQRDTASIAALNRAAITQKQSRAMGNIPNSPVPN
jgi:hypothetical protein